MEHFLDMHLLIIPSHSQLTTCSCLPIFAEKLFLLLLFIFWLWYLSSVSMYILKSPCDTGKLNPFLTSIPKSSKQDAQVKSNLFLNTLINVATFTMWRNFLAVVIITRLCRGILLNWSYSFRLLLWLELMSWADATLKHLSNYYFINENLRVRYWGKCLMDQRRGRVVTSNHLSFALHNPEDQRIS